MLNRRRVELIKKDIIGQLTGLERDEPSLGSRNSAARMDKAFPLPPAEISMSLIRLRDSLRDERLS